MRAAVRTALHAASVVREGYREPALQVPAGKFQLRSVALDAKLTDRYYTAILSSE